MRQLLLVVALGVVGLSSQQQHGPDSVRAPHLLYNT